MDRGYLDFGRLFTLNQAGTFFVIRAKSNTQYTRRYSHPIDKSNGLICDQSIMLTGVDSKKAYPQLLRRIKYHDTQIDKTFNFLTNNFLIPAQTVADLYRSRWQVELFFKWIKQHLRIKSFFGISENAVKSQIWIAISVYVLVAIIKKRLKLTTDLYTILQILSLTLFEKTPLDQLLISTHCKNENTLMSNQLNLFD
jgi:IS4 transposase